MSNPLELILYACPAGALGEQLALYFAESHKLGTNAGHRYPPHISLTGFFHDVESSLPIYQSSLQRAVRKLKPPTEVVITELRLDPRLHALRVSSPGLEGLAARFSRHVESPSRTDDIRLKSRLHLSLAYEFPTKDEAALAKLARRLVNPQAPVSWTVGLYERFGDNKWRCHCSCEIA